MVYIWLNSYKIVVSHLKLISVVCFLGPEKPQRGVVNYVCIYVIPVALLWVFCCSHRYWNVLLYHNFIPLLAILLESLMKSV